MFEVSSGESMSLIFKAGDVVQLKSGGPAMTVAELPKERKSFYVCQWFKGASKERGTFFEHELKTYVPPQKP